MSFDELVEKRHRVLRDIEKCNRMLVETSSLPTDSMFGIDIRTTLDKLNEQRRFIILCCLDRLEFKLRRITSEIRGIREE